MKFLTVFVALLSVAFGYQASWTLPQLSEAIQNPSTDPAILPYLHQALDEMMDAIYAGQQIEAVTVTIPAIDLSSWSLTQLSNAIENPNTDAALLPYLEQALNELMLAIITGQPTESVSVVVPSMDISSWTLHELSAALENPTTNPALVPYLENALNEMMSALFAGQHMDSIVVVVPAGLLESPIVPVPVVPSPVEAPIVPAPVESPAAPSSPLVQIIVNVNKGAVVAPAPVMPEPAIIPEPVIVVEQPLVVPEPVIIVDGPSVVPEPVIIVDGPSVVPEPVIIVDGPSAVPEPVIIGTPVLPVVPEPVIIGTPVLPVVPEPVIIGTPVLPNPVDVLHPILVNPIAVGGPIV